MAVRRLAVSRPSATTDNSLFTADSEYLVSVIATNTNTSSAGLIRVWVVPAGAISVAEYSQIVYDIEVPISNSYETFRFAINQNDVVYVRSSIANMSFTLNGVQQYDIQLGVGVTSFQPTAPSNPINGQLWVDSDALASTVDSSDYLLKTEAATGYYAKTSSASSGEASTVNINTKPWNMPWGNVATAVQLGAAGYSAGNALTVLTLNVPVVAGRRYEVSGKISVQASANSGPNALYVSAPGITPRTLDYTNLAIGTNLHATFRGTVTISATEFGVPSGTGTVALGLFFKSGAGGGLALNPDGYVSANSSPQELIVKDIGPA